MRKTRHSAKHGIALLEVLLTVSILAFGLGAALQAISTCTRTQSRLGRQNTARTLAERQLATLRLQGAAGLQTDMGGEFPAPHADFSWSAEGMQPTDDTPFALVDVTVWKGQNDQRKRVYSLQTLIN